MSVGEKQHHEGLVAPAGFWFFFQLVPAALVTVPCVPVADGGSWCPVLLWGRAAAAAGSEEGKQESLISQAPCFEICCQAG